MLFHSAKLTSAWFRVCFAYWIIIRSLFFFFNYSISFSIVVGKGRSCRINLPKFQLIFHRIKKTKKEKKKKKKKKKTILRRRRLLEMAVLIDSSQSTLVIGVSVLFPVPWSLQPLPRNRPPRKQPVLSIAAILSFFVYVKSIPPFCRADFTLIMIEVPWKKVCRSVRFGHRHGTTLRPNWLLSR